MIVPGSRPSEQSAGSAQPASQPSLTDLLMAAAVHQKLAALTEKDQPMIEYSNRTAKGVDTAREGAMRGREQFTKPLNTDRIMVPGERVPNAFGKDIRRD